jgi:hypothetical protein
MMVRQANFNKFLEAFRSRFAPLQALGEPPPLVDDVVYRHWFQPSEF